MSFYTIKNPVERDKTIHEFLTIKKRIKQRELNERVGDMVRKDELEQTYKPLIESNEKTINEIKKSIEPLATQMETANKTTESENTMKNVSSDNDQYFGLVHNAKKGLVMGNKQVELIDDDTMKIEDTNYKITDGLWSLITKKIPTGYTEADYNTYKDIVRQTEVIKYPSNTTKKSRPHSTGKYKNLLSKIEIENESTGKGVNFLPADINSLVTKLQLLVGEFIAGNKTTRNQIVAILDNLKERRKISETEYTQVNKLLQ